jgi:HD superfamily phosphohydrolase
VPLISSVASRKTSRRFSGRPRQPSRLLRIKRSSWLKRDEAAAAAFARLKGSTGFASLVRQIEEWLDPALATYLERFAADAESHADESRESKAIKDAIWGMIAFSPEEIAIIDSPPFQRLRRVRQLGVTYVTYPTATHSRFEHSLGAVHQVDRMLHAIALRSDERFRSQIDQARRVARLAALLHDIGHLPLSHVSERFYDEEECTNRETLESVADAIAEVGAALRTEAKLSECLSIAIIAAPSFERLLTMSGYQRDEIAAAAVSIVGRPPSLRLGFVNQLITNIVDADKLDYMFRDSLMTKAPLAVDLERLLHKLVVVEVSVDDLGDVYQSMSDRHEKEALVLATDTAGDRSMFELAVSRQMLWERIYLHHKTRAAERVALSVLSAIDGHPAELLQHGDEIFTKHEASEAGVRMLLLRDLPRRAFAFSREFILEPANDYGYSDFMTDLESVESRGELAKHVIEEAHRAAKIVGRSFDGAAVWIDTTPRPPKPTESDFKVIRPDKSIGPGGQFADEASAYPHSAMRISFFYATGTREQVEFAHVATEKAVAEKYDLYFSRQPADLAKINSDQIQTLKRRIVAADADFFKDVPRLVAFDDEDDENAGRHHRRRV